jgi:hypothetical protein
MLVNHAIGKTLVLFDPQLPAARAGQIVGVLNGDESPPVREEVSAEKHQEIWTRNQGFAEKLQQQIPGLVMADRDRDAYLQYASEKRGLPLQEAEHRFARESALQLIAEDGSYSVIILLEDDILRLHYVIREIRQPEQIDAVVVAFRDILDSACKITGFKPYDIGAKRFLDKADDLEEFFSQSAQAAGEVMLLCKRYNARMRFLRGLFHFLNVTVLFVAALLVALSVYFAEIVKDVIPAETVNFRISGKQPAEDSGIFPDYQLFGTLNETAEETSLTVPKSVYDAAEPEQTIRLYETGKPQKPLITKEEYDRHMPVYHLGFATVTLLGFFALPLILIIGIIYARWLRRPAGDRRDNEVVRAVQGYIWVSLAVLLGAGYGIVRMFLL